MCLHKTSYIYTSYSILNEWVSSHKETNAKRINCRDSVNIALMGPLGLQLLKSGGHVAPAWSKMTSPPSECFNPSCNLRTRSSPDRKSKYRIILASFHTWPFD